jgi:hypothetical protein
MLHDRSYQAKFKTENDAGQTYELRGRLDISSRTTAALIAHEVQQESRDSIDAVGNSNSARPDVTTDRATAAFNHRFNRLSLQLRGGQAETRYDEYSQCTSSQFGASSAVGIPANAVGVWRT